MTLAIEGHDAALEPLVNDILDTESSERQWLRDIALKSTDAGWIVTWKRGTTTHYLRWSKGPVQGFFWDAYPDTFDKLGWAIRALVTAPPPPTLLIRSTAP